VPSKIQEFLLVTVDACALSEKIQGLACDTQANPCFQQKKRTSLSHSELI
jgi:hypothetical protein